MRRSSRPGRVTDPVQGPRQGGRSAPGWSITGPTPPAGWTRTPARARSGPGRCAAGAAGAAGAPSSHRAELPGAHRRGRLSRTRRCSNTRRSSPAGCLADGRRDPVPVPSTKPGSTGRARSWRTSDCHSRRRRPRAGAGRRARLLAFNDLTARRAQKLTAQWTLGKNGDRSGPLGPLVPPPRSATPRRSGGPTRINGEGVQTAPPPDGLQGR